MGNSLRCCLACVLPCGALDLIRIVHLNGYVEEITRPVTAGEILKSYPNHVLSKPCSQGMVRKILILSSDSELKRGSIYFLIPDSSLPSDSKPKRPKENKIKAHKVKQSHHDDDDHDQNHQVVDDNKISKPKKIADESDIDQNDQHNNNKFVSLDLGLDLSTLDNGNVVVCEVKPKSKSKSGKHQRRRSSRGKSGVWQPHLECITEDL